MLPCWCLRVLPFLARLGPAFSHLVSEFPSLTRPTSFCDFILPYISWMHSYQSLPRCFMFLQCFVIECSVVTASMLPCWFPAASTLEPGYVHHASRFLLYVKDCLSFPKPTSNVMQHWVVQSFLFWILFWVVLFMPPRSSVCLRRDVFLYHLPSPSSCIAISLSFVLVPKCVSIGSFALARCARFYWWCSFALFHSNKVSFRREVGLESVERERMFQKESGRSYIVFGATILQAKATRQQVSY